MYKRQEYKEISAIVLFNSAFDKNIPAHTKNQTGYLDWELPSLSWIEKEYSHSLPDFFFDPNLSLLKSNSAPNTKRVVLQTDLKAVGYKKGQNWSGNNYVLTREELEKDFSKMQQIGIRQIRYEGGLYDTNVLSISKSQAIEVLYSFWIPDTLHFVDNNAALKNIESNILGTISQLKTHSNINAWCIGNKSLKHIFNKVHAPRNLYEKAAYFSWIKALTNKMKMADSAKPIILEITASNENLSAFKELVQMQLPIDYYGFRVTSNIGFKAFKQFAEQQGVPFIISDISAPNLEKLQQEDQIKNSIISNWQDQWENNKVSFDGLLDRKGRTKNAYHTLSKLWSSKPEVKAPQIRILSPAELIRPNRQVTFYALTKHKENWQYPTNTDLFKNYEWTLVKQDLYGNNIALKSLGKGNSITFKVPKDYHEGLKYEILLSYTFNEECVTTYRTPLNTPIPKAIPSEWN